MMNISNYHLVSHLLGSFVGPVILAIGPSTQTVFQQINVQNRDEHKTKNQTTTISSTPQKSNIDANNSKCLKGPVTISNPSSNEHEIQSHRILPLQLWRG